MHSSSMSPSSAQLRSLDGIAVRFATHVMERHQHMRVPRHGCQCASSANTTLNVTIAPGHVFGLCSTNSIPSCGL